MRVVSSSTLPFSDRVYQALKKSGEQIIGKKTVSRKSWVSYQFWNNQPIPDPDLNSP
jgi:hypothetical protein